MTEDGEHYYVNVATDDEGKQTRRVKVTVVTQNDNEAVVGKTQVKRDDQGIEINPNVPVTKLRDGDTLRGIRDVGALPNGDLGDVLFAHLHGHLHLGQVGDLHALLATARIAFAHDHAA